jgi:AraC-like DNA-binding protein
VRRVRILEQAEKRLSARPQEALVLIERFLNEADARKQPVVVARARWMRAQAQAAVGFYPDSGLEDLQHAVQVFLINERHLELGAARVLHSRYLLAKGEFFHSLGTAIAAFNDERLPIDTRLAAARNALMVLTLQSSLQDYSFSERVKVLCASMTNIHIVISIKAVMALGEFFRLVELSGTQTSSNPYQQLSAVMTREEAQRRTAGLLDELHAALAQASITIPEDPAVLPIMALLRAYVEGMTAAAPAFAQVRQLYGRDFDAWLCVVEGVALVLNHAHQQAVPVLQQASRLGKIRGMVFVSVLAQYWLHRSYDELGRYQEALTALTGYHAWRHTKLDGIAHKLSIGRVLEEPEVSGADSEVARSSGAMGHIQSEPPYLRRAIRFMQGNLAQSPSITEIVAASGVSRRSLETAFQLYRQTTPMAALRRMRLEAALIMLQNQGASVSTVREAVGYSSASAFSRDFRDVFGVTPRTFANPLKGVSKLRQADDEPDSACRQAQHGVSCLECIASSGTDKLNCTGD